MNTGGKLLCVLDRISARGGADQYLAQVLDVAAGPGERHVLCGFDDGTLDVTRVNLTSVRHLAGLGGPRTAPDPASDLPALRQAIRDLDPERILIQNVMDPDLLDALASDPRAVVVVQDHRTFCPARGKVFPDGTPCREPVGPACDRCFEREGEIDLRRRDLHLELVRRRSDALRQARVVVLSEYMRRELAAAGHPPHRITVIAPPVPDWTVEPRSPEHDVTVVGRISWQKGQLWLLEALAAANMRCEICFVGDGPGADDLRRASDRLRLPITITGWLDRQGVRDVLLASRVAVLPSLWAEPFGIAGLEAAACAVPVVAWDVGAVREWMEPGRTGLLVPPGESHALVRAIRSLLDDSEMRRRLGQQAVLRARASFPRSSFRALWRAKLGYI